MARNTAVRFVHDAGLAAWFGGSLMGAIGLNGAANDVRDPTDRLHVASRGWGRWAPVNALAIGAHLVAGAQLVAANRHRLGGQRGVASTSGAKTALTAAALAATTYSGYLGKRANDIGEGPTEGAVKPTSETPEQTAHDMRALRALQWVVPALTGGILFTNALLGEQQRASDVLRGTLMRAGRATGAAAKHPGATAQIAKRTAHRVVS